MSKHIFTVEVECADSDEYEQFVRGVGALGGEITDEESDFEG